MSSKMEESLGLPKREIYTSLAQLHSKIDGISASTKHWIRPAIDFSYSDNVTDTVKENETLSFLTNFLMMFSYSMPTCLLWKPNCPIWMACSIPKLIF